MLLMGTMPAVTNAYQFGVVGYTQNVPSDPFAIVPAINNAGVVAFKASLDGTINFPKAIHFGTSPADLVTLEASGDPALNLAFAVGVAINDSGAIAFNQNIRTGGQMIYRFSGGVFEQMVAEGGPFGVAGYNGPGLANDGRVVFGAANDAFAGGVVGTGTFLSDGLTLNTIFSTPSNQRLAAPDISGDGSAVVFGTSGFNGDVDGIYSIVNGELRTIATIGSFFTSLTTPTVNNLGQVAFGFAGSGGFVESVLVGDGITPAEIVATRGVGLYSSFGNIAINNMGKLAFEALTEAGVSGIFTGADPLADLVIGVGSPLDGSTVLSLKMGREGLNDDGTIAFHAFLADGRQGVYTAVIPAPSGLAAIPLSVLAITRRRRCARPFGSPQ